MRCTKLSLFCTHYSPIPIGDQRKIPVVIFHLESAHLPRQSQCSLFPVRDFLELSGWNSDCDVLDGGNWGPSRTGNH